MAADLSLAGVRLVIADLALGLPVLRTLSLCTCRRQYPGVATGRTLRSTRPAVSAFPDMAVGSACTLALSPIRDTLIEGFSHFVTSMTAPIASGWSGCRVGLTPTGKRRLCTAHANNGNRRFSSCERRTAIVHADRPAPEGSHPAETEVVLTSFQPAGLLTRGRPLTCSPTKIDN